MTGKTKNKKRKTPPPSSPNYRSRSPLPKKATPVNTMFITVPTNHNPISLPQSSPNSNPTVTKTEPTHDISSDSDDNLDTLSQSSKSSTEQTPTPKIPPFFLSGSAWSKVAPKLMTSVPTDSITARVVDTNFVQIQCIDPDLYRVVQKYFQTTATEYHTYPSPSEHTLKVVIKGLLSDICETEVADGLKLQGYDILNVRQLSNSTRKFPIHMIALKSTPSNKEIFNMNTLFHVAV